MILNDMHEECGIFGIYNHPDETAQVTYLGLYALQHRGQESNGIAGANPKTIIQHKGMGLVKAGLWLGRDALEITRHPCNRP